MIKDKKEWIASLRDASVQPHAPVQQKEGQWKISDRLVAWKETGPRIFDEYLDRLRKLAVRVLREKDPQFELDPEDRFFARSRGKSLSHSAALRSGLAETLALLGSFPKFLTSASLGKPEATAAAVVRDVLEDADWTLWASLNDLLPMFAEAAPDQFIEAVERALACKDAPFANIFAQEVAGVMGRNYITGLLWALETLAWSRDHLTQVVDVLGQLAAIDPGGNWSNRPFNSIVDVLLPWHPQTTADIPTRIAAVRVLVREQPAIGWKLLLALLPQAHGVTSGTRKPTWRKFIPSDWSDTVTNKDYWDQVGAYADLAVDMAEEDWPRLTELCDRIPTIPDSARDRLLEFLGSSAVTEASEGERKPVWEELVKLASVHRQYSDAEWAMNSGLAARLEGIAMRLEPRSPAAKYHRLFSGLDFELYEEKSDYEAQERKLEEKRQQAVNEIFAASGTEGVIAFADSVDAPVKVGGAFGIVADESVDSALLPKLLEVTERRDFISGFVWSRVQTRGPDWPRGLETGRWSEDAKLSLLLKLPFRREFWELAATLLGGNEDRYWATVSPNQYQIAEDDLTTAVELLLAHKRPRAAIQCLSRVVFTGKEADPSLVSRTLLEAVTTEDPVTPFDQHAVRQLIKWLQGNPQTTSDQLFQVEWAYLPLLDRLYGGVAPKTLEGRLARDPSFFCEVIAAVFRSDKVERSATEASEAKKRIAVNGYRLLHDWRTPPGMPETGSWDENAFRDWLMIVKRSTTESGHYDVAMSQIGQVLPYAPADPKNLWIHHAVANALNAKDAERMRSGFVIKLFNMRGVHGFSHGAEERQIANDLRQKAEAVEKATYHRFATALRDLAQSYERDAEREAARSPLD